MKMLFLRNILFRRKEIINEGDNNIDNKEKKDVPLKKRNEHSYYRIFGRIKDIVHDICYFPDHASPWIPNAILAGFRIIKREKPDIIFATGMPWSALVVANILHQITRIPYICDFRDPWIDNPFHESKGFFIDKINKYFEKVVVRKSALITANTVQLKNQMACRYPELPKGKIKELPNGYDPSDFIFLEDNVGRNTSSIRLTLVHAGYLYGERSPFPILNAIDLTYKKYEYDENEIKFIQIGSLEDKINKEMEKYIALGYAQNLGQLSHQICIQTLRKADILVIIQQSTETQVPSKIYEYICLNKPIITITKRGGALWNLQEEYKFGDLFEPDDIESISNKIQEHYIMKKKTGYLKEEYPRRIEFDIREISKKLSNYMMDICLTRDRN